MARKEKKPVIEKIYTYRDTSRIVKIITALLVASMAMDVAMIISNLFEHNLLTAFQNGSYTSHEKALVDATANDQRQQIINIINVIVLLAAYIFAGRWIYLANANSRALGAKDMKFTPGYSVGWYFVPIAALYKPYQAMKEIYKTSVNPENWQDVKVPKLFPLWWTLWIVVSLIDRAFMQSTVGDKSIPQLIKANEISSFCNTIDIPLNLIFLLVVLKISNAQKHYKPSK